MCKCVLLFVLIGVAISHAVAVAQGASPDAAKIEELTGEKGKLDEKEGAFKVSVPRSDLSVIAAGVRRRWD